MPSVDFVSLRLNKSTLGGHGRPREPLAASRGGLPSLDALAAERRRRQRQTYEAPLPSGSMSAALAACGMSGWPHFQQ